MREYKDSLKYKVTFYVTIENINATNNTYMYLTICECFFDITQAQC